LRRRPDLTLGPGAATGRRDGIRLEEGRSSAWQRRLHRACLRARPTQLGAILKVLTRVRREYAETAGGPWLWVDPASQLGSEVLSARDYEPSMSATLRALLRPGDVFVDVGANEGFFSVVGSSLVGHGRVVAIEPQTRLIGVVLRNLEINGCRNVTLRAVALDLSTGWSELHLRPSTNTGASGLFRRRFDVSTESVPALRLDDVLDQEGVDRVRVLKVDCEGAEDRVVEGTLDHLVSHRVDFLLMEYHPSIGSGARERSLALHARLLDLGYVLSRSLDRHIYHCVGAELDLASLGEVRTGVAPTL